MIFCLIYHLEGENAKVLEEVEDTLGKMPVSLSDHMEGCLWTENTYTIHEWGMNGYLFSLSITAASVILIKIERGRKSYGCFWVPRGISEKAMAPHSSALAWKIPWMEEPGRL